MLKLRINKQILNVAIGAVYEFVTEARFKVTESGIYINMVDPANIAMISVDLEKEAFIEYHADPAELGVDIYKLWNALQNIQKDDIVSISLDETKHLLIIRSPGIEYSMNLLDLESIRKEPKVPTIETELDIRLNSSDILRALKAMKSISEFMWIRYDSDKSWFEGSNELDSVRATIDDANIEYLQKPDHKIQAMYSLDYLEMAAKTLRMIDTVVLKLKSDFPLKAEAELNNGICKIRYIFAPRVETE